MALYDPAAKLAQTRSFGYDLVNRVVSETGAQGQATGYTHDPQGNLIKTSDPLNDNTSFGYDALNRKIQTTDAAGGVTQYAYDPLDRLTSETDPRGLVTTYAYDGLGDQTGVTSPDAGATVKTYDAAGNVATSTDARGKVTTYTYDALNRVTKADYADGTSTVYRYDQGKNGIGHLTTMTDSASITTWKYDRHGRVTTKTQKTDRVTLTTRLDYDQYGRVNDIVYPSGKEVDLSYDAAGQVNGLSKDNAWIITDVAYRPFGPAASWREGNGAAFIRAFDTDGRIAEIALGATDTNPATRTSSFTYDPASRIIGIAETGQDSKTYSYDSLNRLTGYAKGTEQSTSWAYDPDGNRTSQMITGRDPSRTAYAYAANSNRLLRIAASNGRPVNVSYDASGDMTFDGVNDYAYDAKGRMRAAAPANGNRRDNGEHDDDHRDDRRATTTYAVNGLGQRIEKRGNGIRVAGGYLSYVHDNAGHVLGEYDGEGRAVEETVWLGDIPVAVMSSQGEDRNAQDRNRDEHRDWDRHHDGDNGRDEHRPHNPDLFYVASDQLGAPHLITDEQGDIVWRWDHGPFGNNPAFTTTHRGEFISTDLRFPGMVFDEETGLNNNGFRTYDPRLGLYHEVDPIGLAGGVNPYIYGGQNPLSNVDPTGQQIFQIIRGAAPYVLSLPVVYNIFEHLWDALHPPPLPPVPPNTCSAANPTGGYSPYVVNPESPEVPDLDMPIELPEVTK